MRVPSAGVIPTARKGRQNGGQHLPAILDRPQRRYIDPETLRWIAGCQRLRQ
jgi:hypothetical protein